MSPQPAFADFFPAPWGSPFQSALTGTPGVGFDIVKSGAIVVLYLKRKEDGSRDTERYATLVIVDGIASPLQMECLFRELIGDNWRPYLQGFYDRLVTFNV